jgi:excisionase family DNA binding protein
VKLLTPESVAEQLAVSRSTVLRMIADGALPAVCLRSGRRKKVWRVRQEVLEKWIISRERQVRTSPQPTTSTDPSPTDLKPLNGHAPDS